MTSCIDLDRSNVNNAYVSGMKEELNMQGTDFNVRPLFYFPSHKCSDRLYTSENQHDLHLRLYCWDDTQYVAYNQPLKIQNVFIVLDF